MAIILFIAFLLGFIVDLISIVLGETLRLGRDQVAKDHGQDYYLYGERARLLRLAGEQAGGVDEALVATHEWPPSRGSVINQGRGLSHV